MIIALPSELNIVVNPNVITFLTFPSVRFRSVEGNAKKRYWQYIQEYSAYVLMVTPYIDNTPSIDVPLHIFFSNYTFYYERNKIFTIIYEQQSRLLQDYWIKTFKGQSPNARKTYG